MATKYLIKNCYCFNYLNGQPQTSVVHIEVTNDKITNLFSTLPEEKYEKTIDAAGFEVFPGGIDTHVHLSYIQGNKAVSADSFKTGSLAAIQGGTTCIMDFVEVKGGDAKNTISDRIDTTRKDKCFVDFAFHFSITDMKQFDLIKDAAKIEKSFKIYTVYNGIKIDSSKDLYKLFCEMAKFNSIAMIHCENDQVIQQNIPLVQQISQMSQVRPTWNEVEATTRVLALAELADCSVHIAHVSLPDAAKVIDAYKHRYNQSKVTCESTSHHLLLNYELYQTRPHYEDLVMAPPLQQNDDVIKLQQSLVHNEIDFTISDHCPFTRSQRFGSFYPFEKIEPLQKERKFYEMPGGTNGIQVRFIATYSILKHYCCSIEQIAKQTSQNAADRFMLPGKGRIQVGFDADIVFIDPNRDTHWDKWVENVESSLFEGLTFRGRVEKVIVRGKESGKDELLQGRYLRQSQLDAQ